MPRTNNPRISQTEWDFHKETIRKLYLSEDRSLMGEGGVIDLMKRKGFSASKPQYESQFMRWGFKKKLSREAWHIIGRIIKERDEAGYISHVYANGTCLSEEKVKKETARYRVCEADGKCCLRKELPTGIEVRSDHEDGDQDEVEETILSLEAQGIHVNNPGTTRHSANLHIPEEPWNLALDYQMNNPNDLHNRMLTDHPTPNFPGDTSPYFPHLDSIPLVDTTRQSPSFWFPDIQEFQDILYIPRSTTSLFTDLNIPIFRGFRALFRNDQSRILASINQTKHLLPGEPCQELQRNSVDVVILKQILYLLMNNFAGSDYAVFDTIFEQVRQFSVSHMEDMLDALPPPYAAALQQSILTIAIKSNIPALVSVLLRRGLDVNRVTCRFGGRQYTPLSLACEFRSLEIVKILLHARADPNRSIHQEEFSKPIYVLLGFDPYFREYTRPIDSDILRYLLEAHAIIPINVLESEKFWECETVLDVYIQYNKLPINLRDTGLFFEGIPESMGSRTPEKVIAVLRSAFQDLTSEEEMRTAERYLESVFKTATKQGSLKIVNYCLERGLTPSLRCLCEAIYGNHLVLVQKYLQLGVEIHGKLTANGMKGTMEANTVSTPVRVFPSTVDSCLLEGYLFNDCPTTPFAEAIRHSRQDIVSLFTSWSLSHAAPSSDCIARMVLAAAEVGNKDKVQELLAMEGEEIKAANRYYPESVAAATLRGSDDIVELLMRAGVRPTHTSIAAAILTRNAPLVELFLHSTISIESETALAYLAVRWGDRNILRLLIDAGVSFGTVKSGLNPLYLPSLGREFLSPLEEAIRRANREIVKLLLENGADINGSTPVNYNSPLKQAVECGDEPLVQTLLDHGADPNDPCALEATVGKSCKLTRAILVSFCQRYPKGNRGFVIPTLLRSIEKQNETLVRMLATHADINLSIYRESGYTYEYLTSVLGKGITTGNIKIVRILLDSGGNPDSTVGFSNQGRLNAVLQAISTGNLEMVKLLHNAKANLDFSATLRINHTALQLAVDLGHFEIVKFLLEQGADVNASPCVWGGGTALQFAAKTGSMRIANMLIEHGADINAPGSQYQGRTAFEFAAEHGRIDMLLLLFHRGVDIASDGGEQIRRARELAEENGQIAAKDLVEQLGAEAQRRAFSGFDNNFLSGVMTDTSAAVGLLGIG